MKVPESVSMSIPAKLIPVAQQVIDDAPDCSFDECLAASSLGASESFYAALITHPKGSNERAKAIREMLEFVSLVQFAEAA